MSDLFCSGYNAQERMLVVPIQEKIRDDINCVDDLKANISYVRGQLINTRQELNLLIQTGGDLASQEALRGRIETLQRRLDLYLVQKTVCRVRAVCCRNCIFDFEENRVASILTICRDRCIS